MLEVGKLYRCEGYFLLLYSNNLAASTAAAMPRSRHVAALGIAADEASRAAHYWSNRLEKPVSYTEKKSKFLVLSHDKEFIQILIGGKVGWIIFRDWLGIEEVC
jgi:hypothetical protein